MSTNICRNSTVPAVLALSAFLWVCPSLCQDDPDAGESREEAASQKAEALVDSGHVFERKGDYIRAVSAWERATQLDPGNASAWYSLGRLPYHMGRYEGAAESLSRAAALDPDDYLIQLCLGSSLGKRKMYEEAAGAFQRALALNESSAIAECGLIVCYDLLGREDEVQAHRVRYFSKFPNRAAARLGIGYAYHRYGDLPKALEEYRAVLQMSPEDSDTRLRLAEVLTSLGRWDQALDEWREAKEALSRTRPVPSVGRRSPKPNFHQRARVHRGLGYVHFKTESVDSAVWHYRAAVELSGGSPRLQRDLAVLYLAQEKYDEAWGLMKEARRQRSKDPLILYLNGFLLQRRGLDEIAEDEFARAREICERRGLKMEDLDFFEPEVPTLSSAQMAFPGGFVPYDTPPQFLRIVKPVYPDGAKTAGVEGWVILKLLVEVDGKVLNGEILKSAGHPELDEAAMEAALKTTFTPALQDGIPVRVWVSYPVQFVLFN